MHLLFSPHPPVCGLGVRGLLSHVSFQTIHGTNALFRFDQILEQRRAINSFFPPLYSIIVLVENGNRSLKANGSEATSHAQAMKMRPNLQQYTTQHDMSVDREKD